MMDEDAPPCCTALRTLPMQQVCTRSHAGNRKGNRARLHLGGMHQPATCIHHPQRALVRHPH